MKRGNMYAICKIAGWLSDYYFICNRDLLIARHRFLPKEKKLGTASIIIIVGTILMLQIIYPEVLLTSICATILLVGIYVDFENPSIRRLTVYNDSMVEGFATMVENRDDNTGGHIRRTRAYVNLMMHKMRHAARGGEIILNTFKNIDNPEFQKIAYEVARFHHEKYNGKGYPDGLSGEQIPLHARVMAIADVFDAVS